MAMAEPDTATETVWKETRPLSITAALSGEVSCHVEAHATSSVGSVKRLIHLATGIEPFEQKLINVRGANLGDDTAILGPGMFTCPLPNLMLVKLDPVGAAAQHAKQLVLENVRAGKSLKSLDEQYRRDQDIVMAAAKLNICQLQHALPEITSDCDFMLDILMVNPVARCYVSQDLWLQREFVLQAVQIEGLLLEYAKEFKDDLGVVLAAAGNNGYALRHAGYVARANKEVVLAAVQQRGCALCHASFALQQDREVALAAVRCERMAVVHVRGGLQKDPEIVKLVEEARKADAVKQHVETLHCRGIEASEASSEPGLVAA